MTKLPSSIIGNVRRCDNPGQRLALLLVIPLVVVVSIPLVLRVLRVPSLHANALKRDVTGIRGYARR
jgi:hypothetical protein